MNTPEDPVTFFGRAGIPADQVLKDAIDIRERLEHQADLVIDGGYLSPEPTTVIDLSGDVPILVRMGKGKVDSFGLEAAKA